MRPIALQEFVMSFSTVSPARGPVSVAVVGSTGCVLVSKLAGLFGRADAATTPKPFQATAVEMAK
jgi:hypothetical protein